MGIKDLAEGHVWRAGADAAVSAAYRVRGDTGMGWAGLSVAVGWSHWAVLCTAPGEIVLATNSSMDLTFAVLQTQK